MNDVDGIGGASDGARASPAEKMPAGEVREGKGSCLNCGTALVGGYCHHCGQAAQIHRSLGALWHDLLHGALHFEGKIWRTLPLLVWRPGELTKRYVDGERARFVSPFALFLFSVFLMFAAFSAVGGPALSTVDEKQAGEAIDTGRREVEARIADLKAERTKAAAAGRDVDAIDRDLRLAQQELNLIDIMTGEGASATAEPGVVNGLGWFDWAYQKAKENPSLLLYKLQSNAYKFSWLLIPISIPFVWLLFFWKRRYKAYDHAVFVTYSIAFMSLLAILLAVGNAVGLPSGPLVAALTFIPPIHMYRQLRGAYALSFAGAFWRTIILLLFAFAAAGLYFTLLLTLGVLG